MIRIKSVFSLFRALSVKARLYLGFAAVLVLLILVAGATVTGLREGGGALGDYSEMSDDSLAALGLDRDFTTLQRSLLAFLDKGDEETRAKLGAMQKKLQEAIGEALQQVSDPQRRQALEQIEAGIKDYLAALDKAVAIADEIAQTRAKTMDENVTMARRDLTALIKSALAAGDSDLAAYAGLAQQDLLLGSLNANRFFERNDARASRQMKVNFQDLSATLPEVSKRIDTPEQQSLMDDIQARVGQYGEGFSQASEKQLALIDLVWAQMSGQAEALSRNVAGLVASTRTDLAATRSGAQSGMSAATSMGLVLSAAALLIGLTLAWLSVRSIVNPVTAMTDAMGRLAGGDTATDIPARERGDEIGRMAQAVQVFKDNMIEAERLRREQAQAEKRAAEERKATMGRMAGEFETAVGGIVQAVAAAAGELKSSAEAMSATAAETSRQSASVAEASEQASTNVQTVAAAAEELSASVQEIARQVAQSNQMSDRAVSEAERTNAKVQVLAESAKKIGEVVDLINDIAGQTNLLALNATIEAARAGEAGKGFAVVASEVKMLANQTARATEDIARQIAAIQSATGESVTAIQGIGGTIREINQVAAAIAAAVEEQGAATQEISRNVQEAARGTTEVSSTIAGVSKATTDTGSVAAQVLSAAGDLSRNSETLRGQLDRFLATVRAA